MEAAFFFLNFEKSFETHHLANAKILLLNETSELESGARILVIVSCYH